jgi:hypothetical protein
MSLHEHLGLRDESDQHMLTCVYFPGTTLIRLGYENSAIPSFVRPDVYDAPCASSNTTGQYAAIHTIRAFLLCVLISVKVLSRSSYVSSSIHPRAPCKEPRSIPDVKLTPSLGIRRIEYVHLLILKDIFFISWFWT